MSRNFQESNREEEMRKGARMKVAPMGYLYLRSLKEVITGVKGS